MGQYAIITRQQFIIPTTPIQTFPSSDLLALDNDGTPFASSTYTDGDSYITTYSLNGGGQSWNFRFRLDTTYLVEPADYFVVTVSLTDIAGELVMQVTKFIATIPYPSYRVRVDLSLYPYTKFSVVPLTTEADFTKVTFSTAPPYTGVKFKVAPIGRWYVYVKLDGFASPRIPYPIFGLGKSFPVSIGVEQFH